MHTHRTADDRMTDRTVIPEFLVGVVSLTIFNWLWTPVFSIQQLTSKLDVSVAGNMSLVLQGAMAVFIIGLYGIIGVYCSMVCAERAIRFAIAHKNRDKTAAEKPMKRAEDYIEELQSTRK
jgi:hypothetical protein